MERQNVNDTRDVRTIEGIEKEDLKICVNLFKLLWIDEPSMLAEYRV